MMGSVPGAVELNIELSLNVDDKPRPLGVAIIEDIMVVADEDSKVGVAVVDPLPSFSGSVELAAEVVLVVDEGLVRLEAVEIEESVSIDDTTEDPPATNSFAAARLIPKETMRTAKAFELIEHIMAVSRSYDLWVIGGQCER